MSQKSPDHKYSHQDTQQNLIQCLSNFNVHLNLHSLPQKLSVFISKESYYPQHTTLALRKETEKSLQKKKKGLDIIIKKPE